MPLDSRKLAHIRRLVARTHAGRQQRVVLTLRTPAGGTTTLAVEGVWRVQADFDPSRENPTNDRFHVGPGQDVFAVFDAGGITLQQLRSCLWAEPLPDGAEPGRRYILLDIEPVGMAPGGTRFITRWTRQQ
jgi:hypothetical protein